MKRLSSVEIKRIEQQYAEGIRSAAIVEIFRAKGYRFSAATLRKYVQLGLLPKSKRVGSRGRHTGSSGLYPVSCVRLVNDIKDALDKGASLDDVRLGIGLTSQMLVLKEAVDALVARFEEAMAKLPNEQRSACQRSLATERKGMTKQIRELERLASRMAGVSPQEDDDPRSVKT